MANIKSQIKRIRTNELRRVRNKAVRSELKTRIKRFDQALAAGDAESITANLRLAVQRLDIAAAKGIIHKNKAANHKSALMKKAAAASSRAAE
jgi:small subunit ribosomal protein S20